MYAFQLILMIITNANKFKTNTLSNEIKILPKIKVKKKKINIFFSLTLHFRALQASLC